MTKQNSELWTREEGKFNQLRQIILASTEFITDGIKFDTDLAKEKGFTAEDIADADYLLTDCSFFANEFLKEIKLLRATEDNPKIYFVEFAKIIFVLNKNNQKSFYIFEEDLHKAVLIHKYMNDWEEHSSQVPES
jgi:hypothetical protein